MKFIDIHSHLTEKRFDGHDAPHRVEIIKEMVDQGISTISIGTDWEESQKAVALARSFDNVYASVGQHPVDNKTEEFDETNYRKLIENNREKIVCVGECGLDYYWPGKDVEAGKLSEQDFVLEKDRQRKLFIQQIDFAVEMDLPLMLHVRSHEHGDAHHDVLRTLAAKEDEHGQKLRANFHFFTETPEIAKTIVDRGYSVSFPGVITFANLDETLRAVPIEHIMSETDSPYAAPVPHRGKSATPLMVPLIVQKIAEAKGLDTEETRLQLLQNAQRFFGIE